MKKFLTTKDLADMLQLRDRRTVLAFMADKGVLPIKVGRLLRWDSEQVMLALTFVRQQNAKPAVKRKPKRNAKSVLSMSAAELFALTSGANAPVQ